MPSALEAWTSREVPKVFIIKVLCQKPKACISYPSFVAKQGNKKTYVRSIHKDYVKSKRHRVGNRE